MKKLLTHSIALTIAMVITAGTLAQSPSSSRQRRTAPETNQDTAATDKPATVSTDNPGYKAGAKSKDKPAPVTPNAQTIPAAQSTHEAACTHHSTTSFTTYHLYPTLL